MANVKSNKMINNLRPMFVKEILLDHTDENHFITVNEILDFLDAEYCITSTRKTLYEDIDLLLSVGLDIECIKGRQNKYHMLSRDFDIAEIRLLIDSVESLRSLPLCKSRELVRKLSRLGGPSADFLVQTGNSELYPRAENTQIYYIIDSICNAIASRKQIAFKYYEYLTSSNKVLKNNGKEYQVSPYRLVCCNEYYYLLGYSEKHEKITAFRVDRICGIPSQSDTDSVPEPDTLYVDKYIKDSVHMKSGDSEEITLDFDSTVIDAMIDRFGQDMGITFISKTQCRAQVTTPINNVFFAWIFGFEGKVRIKGPKDINERYVRMVSKEMARL